MKVLATTDSISTVDPAWHLIVELTEGVDFGAMDVGIGGDGLNFRESSVLVALCEPKANLDVVLFRCGAAEAHLHHEADAIAIHDHGGWSAIVDQRSEAV